MPKGVDHLRSAMVFRRARSVQKSLMPKGVDHARLLPDVDGRVYTVQKSLMPKGVDHVSLLHFFLLRFQCKNL